MNSKRIISFVTSNTNKLAEVNAILGGDYTVQHIDADTREIQGSYRDVVIEKCLQAYAQTNAAVLVEDTSLGFNALGGLPGPYIKDFLTKLGPNGLHRLLEGFADKTAKAVCVFAYLPSGSTPKAEEVQVFEGVCPGRIVAPRFGEGASFGWDPCFEPNDSSQTFAEMSFSDKNKLSHRSKALQALRCYFEGLQ